MKRELRQSKLVAYAVATGCVLVALGIRWLLAPRLGEQAPLAWFTLATVGAAAYGGLGPGVAAMAAGALVGDYFFVRPYHTFGPSDVAAWTSLFTYGAVTGTCLVLTEAVHRTQRRAERFRLLAQSRADQLGDSLRRGEERLPTPADPAATEQLADHRQALELERSRYRELFNSAPVAYVITSPQGVIEQVNLAAATLLNENPDFLVGFPLARLMAREERAAFFTNLGRLTRGEVEKLENWELLIQPHNRPAFPCALAVNLVRDAPSRLTGLRWLMRDITERKQAQENILRLNAELEQRVRERTAALEAANRELEAFSYSVSHDLRAPLRSIIGFSKAVLEDHHQQLDPQGLEYLQYAVEAGQRMSRLIEDLMELSRAGRGELHQQEVDLSALATLVLAELRKQEPQRSVAASVAPRLVARGDEGLLRIALENLLANAWKFTSRQSQPRIEVSSTERNGSTLYFVRDNGVGFDMAHADRLFGVFQRLHSQAEFPGTGIGLATVRRIFTRHGGDVWAEARVNEGATFYFTLPNGQ